MVKYTSLREISTSTLEREKDVFMRLILKDKNGNRHDVYHFVDADLWVEISSKKRRK